MIPTFSNNCNNVLPRLRFKNTGQVTRDMQFEYHDRPCYYVEDTEKWSTQWGPYGTSTYRYLYGISEDVPPRKFDPPSGMRSAVPLGGLGAGTIELRADGSLRDWNIFNNSPADGGEKVHLDEAIFGLRTKVEGADAKAWVLRTHPPASLPSIAQIEYSGDFPVSRLRFADNDLPLAVDLYAYCEFRIRDPEGSATPAVIFSFNLHNPFAQTVEASLMFNLPNHIGGHYSSGKGLTLSKEGRFPYSGTMALRIAGEENPVSWSVTHSLVTLWKEFADKGVFSTSVVKEATADHGALGTSISLAPGESQTVTFVLSWYLPYRPHGEEIVGNYYTNLYKNADDVADKVIARLPSTWDAIHQWQQLCFDNFLSEWLQDALVNSVATMYKTGMWFEDGRFRQWESFSCPAVDPIHIHFYRSLPYAWFFPSLQQNLLKAYADAQTDDGYIQEHLADSGASDNPGGRQMGDGCTTFVLEVYQNYLWTGEVNFLNAIWPKVKKAAEWQMDRCEKYGLPNNLNNTYDWWGFEHKRLVSYNAFLHLAAMLAAEKLAEIFSDTEFAESCRRNLESARKSLYERLWTGEYFRSWWMADGEYPDALHADTLYGQLWAFILGLGWTAEPDKIKSHLATDRAAGDEEFMRLAWPAAKKAAKWAIKQCGDLGLPVRLCSSYELNYPHKDNAAYNSFLYVAGLLAAKEMAQQRGDAAFVSQLEEIIEQARKLIRQRFWTGEYFRAWWNRNGKYPDAIQSDTLYGQLWASVLGLESVIEPEKIRSHLLWEKKLNETRFGLQQMSRRTNNPHYFWDETIFPSTSMSWAAQMIYFGGRVEEGFSLARKPYEMIYTLREDPWNVFDAYAKKEGVEENLTGLGMRGPFKTDWRAGYPWCNSHYARYTIMWSIPLALSGQQYSAPEKTLSFNPKKGTPNKLPNPLQAGLTPSE